MNKLIAAAALAATAAGCSQARGEDGGPTVARNYPVGAFERIEVAGPYDVEVRTGSAPSVQANGPEKAIERMVVEIEGGRLMIHPRDDRGLFRKAWNNDHKVRLTVTVPQLRGADIAGSGNIRIDRVQGDTFDGQIAGSGNLDVGAVEVQSLVVGVAGSGETRLGGGRARTIDIDIAGSGDIDARGVTAETAAVSIAGSGNVIANATGTAKVDIAGSGDVELSGGARCTVSKQGSGNVRCT